MFRVFGGHFEFLIRGLLVRSLKTEITEVWDRREKSQYSRIQPIARRAISVISVPDLAPTDRARIQNSKWPPKPKVRR